MKQEGSGDMKVCLIVEGSYPYVTGGISGWLQQMLRELKDMEFSILAIKATRNENMEFKYKIPQNVTEIKNIYLLDDDYINKRKKKVRLSKKEYEAFESLFFGEDVDWSSIFDFFKQESISINQFLGGYDFLKMTKDYYSTKYNRVIFSDFLWTMRSMYLPLFMILKSGAYPADIYHSLSTGYAGIIGSMQKSIFQKPLIISEHGIYTREREEEIIKASWVNEVYKDIWIQQFKKISDCCYQNADVVTSLFKGARELQIELGCPKDKTKIIPNGVNISEFSGLPQKEKDESINIGAILRVTPIKDVKTMITAFSIAKGKNDKLKLWIMGPLDESPQYVKECQNLVEDLQVKDVIFTDKVSVKDYIGKMDMLVLSSLSEGQPLSILEGFAAKKPYITTNVGNCYGLLYGEHDTFGDAGIVVPPMNVEKMGEAMLKIANDSDLRKKMGEAGYQRVVNHHDNKEVLKQYRDLYSFVMEKERRK